MFRKAACLSNCLRVLCDDDVHLRHDANSAHTSENKKVCVSFFAAAGIIFSMLKMGQGAFLRRVVVDECER